MNRIKDLRLEKGVSQNKLAKALGLTQQAISAYENGLREPDLETLNFPTCLFKSANLCVSRLLFFIQCIENVFLYRKCQLSVN